MWGASLLGRAGIPSKDVDGSNRQHTPSRGYGSEQTKSPESQPNEEGNPRKRDGGRNRGKDAYGRAR